MLDQELLVHAIDLANYWHAGQVDKQGDPYILHIMRVVTSVRLTSVWERACAALHDIVEDTPITLPGLASAGYSHDVIHVLAGLTRGHERYDHYIQNKVADERTSTRIQLARIRIKLADLDDHLGRLHGLTISDRERLAPRYIDGREYLENRLAVLEADVRVGATS
jgi:(p)ppGpp synthase/HD superfamily hydrolase